MTILRIWLAEKVERVYQLLDEFKEAIWQSYDEDILEMHKTMRIKKTSQW